MNGTSGPADTLKVPSAQEQDGQDTTLFGTTRSASAFCGSAAHSTSGYRFTVSQASSAQVMQCSALGLDGTAFNPKSLFSSTPTTTTIPAYQGCDFQKHPAHASGLSPIDNPAPRPRQNPVEQRAQSIASEQLSFNGLPLERSHVNSLHGPGVSGQEEDALLFVPGQSNMDRGAYNELLDQDVYMAEAPRSKSPTFTSSKLDLMSVQPLYMYPKSIR